MFPGMELMACADLAVPLEVMQHVVRVESAHNPYAIGVVGGHLARQPKNLAEALSTVRMLESRGFNFSLGIAQVNRYNLGKYGLDSYEKAFDVCPNLQAGSRILAECYGRSGRDWGKSFSCYYSGNFVTGYRHGYVQKIYASMRRHGADTASSPQGLAIPVVSRPSRRSVGISRYPLHSASRMAEIALAPSQPVPTPGVETPPHLVALPAPAAADAPVLLQSGGRAPVTAALLPEARLPAPAIVEQVPDEAFVF
ncbi:MAG: lytic transglycosylase domain-containing protein [Pseudomonas sp.]|nr:MAG: lytic transglycosylase domain-containing protein [Pseudomonas sp.]